MPGTQLRLYSKPQAAELLGVSVRTVTRLINNGKLTACKVGSCIRVPKSSIEHYIKKIIEDYAEENGQAEF